MAETIYIEVGRMNAKKNDGSFGMPLNRRQVRKKEDIDLVGTLHDGREFVGLKAYNTKDIAPADLAIIKEHNKNKTDDGREYYSFTQGRTLEEIKQVKKAILERLQKKSVFPNAIQNDETVFGPATITFDIPKFVIDKQQLTEKISWNCWDDIWGDPSQQSYDRQLLEQLYKKNGKINEKGA